MAPWICQSEEKTMIVLETIRKKNIEELPT